MIIECPSCHARYLVQIALFAQGGRKVRCARCKNEWQAALPNRIDVFEPATVARTAPPPLGAEAADAPLTEAATPAPVTANLPAVRKKWHDTYGILKYLGLFLKIAILIVAILAWPVMDRDKIIKALPELRGFYQTFGFPVSHSGAGLAFEQVKSELRYDGGTMRLFVDGVVHNTTQEMQFVPDIMARALGPDRHIIQSWWVAAPAATVDAGAELPFHTEVNTPMKRTIEDVYLEFYAQDEKGDVSE